MNSRTMKFVRNFVIFYLLQTYVLARSDDKTSEIKKTGLKPGVIDIDIITSVQRVFNSVKSPTPTDIPSHSNSLIKAIDSAFEQISNSVFSVINNKDSDIASIGAVFLDNLSTVKWSIDDLHDSTNYTRDANKLSSSVQDTEDATFKALFAVNNFVVSAVKLFDVVSTSANAKKIAGPVLVDFLGALQLALDYMQFIDGSMNFISGQSSKILKSAHSIIFELFSSSTESASNQAGILNGKPWNFSNYFGEFRTQLNISASQYNSRYRDLFGTVENPFEIVTRISTNYGAEMEHLMKLFSSVALSNAASQFKDVLSFINSPIGTMDFMLSTLTDRVPDVLLVEANNLTAAIHVLEENFKLFAKCLAPPIKKFEVGQIEVIAAKWASTFESFQTAAYKFEISATSYPSNLVNELVSTVDFLLQYFADFFFVMALGANELIHLFTGTKSAMLDAYLLSKEYAHLTKSVNDVMKSTSALYPAKPENVAVALKNIIQSAGEAFDTVLGVLNGEIADIPNSITSLMGHVKEDVHTLKSDTLQLLATVTSLSHSAIDNDGQELIENDAQQLADDIELFIQTMTQLIQESADIITTNVGVCVNWLTREVLTSVLEIDYYIVSSIERYVNSVTGSENTVLTDITKGFLTALTQTTAQVNDYDKMDDGNPSDLKLIAGQVHNSLSNSIDKLKTFLGYITRPLKRAVRNGNK